VWLLKGSNSSCSFEVNVKCGTKINIMTNLTQLTNFNSQDLVFIYLFSFRLAHFWFHFYVLVSYFYNTVSFILSRAGKNLDTAAKVVVILAGVINIP